MEPKRGRWDLAHVVGLVAVAIAVALALPLSASIATNGFKSIKQAARDHLNPVSSSDHRRDRGPRCSAADFSEAEPESVPASASR